MKQFVPTFESFTGAAAHAASLEKRDLLSAQYGGGMQENEFDPEKTERKRKFDTAERLGVSLRDLKLKFYLRDLLERPISIDDKRRDAQKTLQPDEIAAIHAHANQNPQEWAEYLTLLEDPAKTKQNKKDTQDQTLDF